MLAQTKIAVVWAQKSSSHLAKVDEVQKHHFHRGPYKYTRTPTHWGLFFLVLGFGLLINAFFITVLTVVSFFITKFVFIKDQENILERRYGEAYKEYKKSVKF
jgi:protein-S-isoprenylcysteine O-methyltransferase Ste14